MRNMLSQSVASNFTRPRLVEGEKYAATPATGVCVGLRDGSGVPATAFGAGAALLVQSQMVQTTDDVRGRTPIVGVQGVAARGAPV